MMSLMTTNAKNDAKKLVGLIKIPSLSHHAYYLVGEDSAHVELTTALAKQHKIKIHGNPDFSDRKYEIFTIDDARELKTSAEMRPTSGDVTTGADADAKKIFVVQMNSVTVEAQNALLKLLEEPASYVHFFLIVPSAHLLLPTVKSRLSFIGTSKGEISNHGGAGVADITSAAEEAATFAGLSVPKRLVYIKKLVDDISDEKRPKQAAIDFLNALESLIHSTGGARKSTQQLEVIEKARGYMDDRAPSVKMLLEYVALNI